MVHNISILLIVSKFELFFKFLINVWWSEGTERCNEALQKFKKKFDIVVNIQGDEPLIEPEIIDGVVKALQVSSLSSHVSYCSAPSRWICYEITLFNSHLLIFCSLFNSYSFVN